MVGQSHAMPTRSTKSWYCRHAGIGSSKCLHLNRDFTNEITSLSLEAAEPLKLTNPQASPSLMETYWHLALASAYAAPQEAIER